MAESKKDKAFIAKLMKGSPKQKAWGIRLEKKAGKKVVKKVTSKKKR